jgi:hypothetical protein
MLRLTGMEMEGIVKLQPLLLMMMMMRTTLVMVMVMAMVRCGFTASRHERFKSISTEYSSD